ncbi:hypothetical protein [Beggiatoa leptomitoformis]|uniref:Uncharacterized protein n=1 Tax=Beggiatoa leptomitoformis TaxID=288004 RepID=A0A2N9YBG6_9GAMM|nr:hypothetical protein [Beggiatoa leptomitoformis]ALG66871.1 hypothetical protein AL038_02995 [Beggiatoa leptomitoformis]AUI67774.1 hypothetical protein BLE401_03045 [Beggiatoa leptomitoformis]
MNPFESSQLRKLCITIHGEELIERLICLQADCEQSVVSETLQKWLTECIFPQLTQKENPISFFTQEFLTKSFSRRLYHALPTLRIKWQWQDEFVKNQCLAILGQCFSQYAYDVRNEGQTQNERRELVEKAVKRLERERDNFQRLKKDPAKLASELFKELGERYSEQLLEETIWAMQPHIDINEDIASEAFLLQQYAPDIYNSFVDWDSFQTCLECTQCPEPLTDDERIAVEIELKKEIENKTEQELCAEYNISRETRRLRFKRAQAKLIDCFSSL